MAKATYCPAKVITKVVEDRPEKVTLELNADEAQVLLDIGAIVGGSDTLSRRRHVYSIVSAIRGAVRGNESSEIRLPWGSLDDIQEQERKGGYKSRNIYFEEAKKPTKAEC